MKYSYNKDTCSMAYTAIKSIQKPMKGEVQQAFNYVGKYIVLY